MVTERQERNEHAATTLEDRQAELASRDLRRQLAAATAVILAAQEHGRRGQDLRSVVERVLQSIQPRAAELLVSAMTLAWRLGRRQVLGGVQTGPAVPDGVLARVVMGADDRARGRLVRAVELAQVLPLERPGDVAAVLAAARRAVTGLETDAGWVVHRSLAMGKHQAAAESGWSLVWVAERNACLHCLAYAGRVIAPYGEFPSGLSYGDHPLRPYGPLVGPPLHPNCRCQLDRTNLRPGELDIGLAREAARSIARGLSDYASNPARFRAVDRLVNGATGLPDAALVQLPRSVIDRARRNFRDGQFRFRPGSPQARAVITQRARDRARTRARTGR
jgi:hypothetical protein